MGKSVEMKSVQLKRLGGKPVPELTGETRNFGDTILGTIPGTPYLIHAGKPVPELTELT